MGEGAGISITDPLPHAYPKPGVPWRIFGSLIRDERDLPFVRLALLLTMLFAGVAILLFYPGMFRWWLAPLYWLPYLWFLGPYILMLHNTSHRVLFKSRYRFLNKYIPWIVGPFFGLPPDTYYAHHIGMHHQEGNLPNDLSSTMRYQRDSFFDFLRYLGSFLVGYGPLTAYLVRKKRFSLARRLWAGELSYWLVASAALYASWKPALVVFVIPYCMTRLMLMVGNWAQHAFVDHDDPTNDYSTVTSFINSPYNHRCFNDGYHLGHHLKASRHWLEMPQDMLDKKDEMVAHRSVVFRKIDYFMITVALWLKQYRFLARHFVNVDPNNALSEEQIIALLKDRVRKFAPDELAALR